MINNNFFATANELEQNAEPFIIATLLAKAGSAPQEVGAKAIITKSGLQAGTIGGGKLEALVTQKAKTLLKKTHSPNKPNKLFKQNLNLKTDVGMTCGGRVEVLYEIFAGGEDWHISIFGAGHIVQSLVPLLLTLPCKIVVYDHREYWLQKLEKQISRQGKNLLVNSAKFKTVLIKDYEATSVKIPHAHWLLSITQGYSVDTKVLAGVLSLPEEKLPKFIGVIGSWEKRKAMEEKLLAQKISPEKLAKVYCPLGLVLHGETKPIGRNTPAEIAISIVAQLLSLQQELGKN